MVLPMESGEIFTKLKEPAHPLIHHNWRIKPNVLGLYDLVGQITALFHQFGANKQIKHFLLFLVVTQSPPVPTTPILFKNTDVYRHFGVVALHGVLEGS